MGSARPLAFVHVVVAVLAAAGCRPDAGVETTARDAVAVLPPPPPTLVDRLPPAPVPRCGDVEPIRPSVTGDGTTELPDPVFLAVVNAYVGEHADVFGGRWLDLDAGGAFVVAFTDDPAPHRAALAARAPTTDVFRGYWPPPQITDPRPIGEWDVAWDVVRVPHTELDLIRAIGTTRTAIEGAGVEMGTADVDPARSRLAVDLVGIDASTRDRLAGLVDPRLVCIAD